jgi:protein TonB
MASSVSGLLAGPGTRPGPSLLPETGAGRGAPAERSPFAGGSGQGTLGRLESVIGSVSIGGAGGSAHVGEGGLLAMPSSPSDATGPPATFARPLGGYQVTPPYPDSARRLGVQGTTHLRFEVLPNGRVGSVQVDRSAGHPDLDQAAVEAIRQWRFEPARRGSEPVTVWVTLPVRFELR